MTTYNRQQQYAIVSVLMQIMEADGVVHPNEVEFLDHVLAECQITEAEMEMIQMRDLEQDIEVLRLMDAAQRTRAAALFERMAECDGFKDPRELSLINQVIAG